MGFKTTLHDAIRMGCRPDIKYVELSHNNIVDVMTVEKALELDNINIVCRCICQTKNDTVAVFY